MTRNDVITLFRAQPRPKNAVEPAPNSWIEADPLVQHMRIAAGRWFTDSRDEVDWYVANEYPDGEVVSLSLSRDEAERYRVSNLPLKPGGKDAPENPRAFSRRPEVEFFLPAEIASCATSRPERLDFARLDASFAAAKPSVGGPAH